MSRGGVDRARNGWRDRGRTPGGLALPLLAALSLVLAAPASGADPPPCAQNGVPGDPALGVASAQTALPGHPVGVAISADGQSKFVSVQPDLGAGLGPLGQLFGLRAPGSVAVLHGRGAATHVVRTIDVGGTPQGMTLTHDGRLLLVTDYFGITLIDAHAALDASASPIVGRLGDGQVGTTEVVLSPDDHYAFVSDQSSSAVSVYDIARARASTPMSGGVIGHVPLGAGTIGLALAPDGRHLFATSELAPGSFTGTAPGTLSVIDALVAEHDPAHALVRSLPAGCAPVRVALSPDGSLAWVAARGSDALVVFDTDMLVQGQEPALRRWVTVGREPVGLALVHAGDVAVVANSNHTEHPQDPQSLSLVDAVAVLAGRPALLGSVPAGAYPRELALSADGTQLLATNFGTSTLQSIDVGTIPEGSDPGDPPARPRLTLRVTPARVRAGHRVRLSVYVSAPGTPDQPAQGMLGAVVRLQRAAVRTNRAGRARLAIRFLHAHRYRLTASRHGYVTATAFVTATAARRARGR